MCGILGFYGNNGTKSERESLICQMISTLQHRGPDGWGYYLSPEVVLGQTRLSIVDLAGGSQPMEIDDHVLVYNGEIYNYPELREELKLKGVHFKTTSDTEVLLQTFIQYGTKAFEKFNGQFAVLIWNKTAKTLTIARDRFGIRPLYYHHFKGQYFFASEMKAFDVIQEYERSINAKQLFNHALLWNTYSDHTVYKNIHSLPGGSFAIFKNGNVTHQESYYEIGNSGSTINYSYNEAESNFTELLDDAVKLRLRSDVPVGAYLSGGIDSSVILSLIRNHTSRTYKTFSVTFEDKEFDESSYQNEMVNLLNTNHFSEDITYDKIDSAFVEAIYHGERPVFRTAPVPLYYLSKIVRKNDIKVVLTGEGADEILWGYDSFKEIKLLEFWSKYPESKLRPLLIKKLYPHLSHYNNTEQFGMMRMFYEGFLDEVDNELASVNIRVHNNQILKNYFNKELGISFDKQDFLSDYRKFLPENYNNWSSLQKSQYQEMRTLLAGYLLSSQGDRMSLAHSVEGRYPFLDHRIIDFLFNVNEKYKLNGFNQKYMLKNAFSKVLPNSILNRPKRPYMAPDLRSFIINGKLTENAEFFLNEYRIREYGIFNHKWVERFLKKFVKGIPENIGYRDNMIITFILSTQIAQYWAKKPRTYTLSQDLRTVSIDDY